MAGGAFLDIFPVESLVFSSGQARLTNDSNLAPLQPGFPSLQPQNIVLGITPIVPSADATALYDGQITKIAGWNGATTMGAALIYHKYFLDCVVKNTLMTKNSQKKCH